MIVGRAPQFHGDRYLLQSPTFEEKSYRWRCDHCGFDSRVVHPNGSDRGWFQLIAVPLLYKDTLGRVRPSRAKLPHLCEVGRSSYRDECCKAAQRESEHAYALRIELRVILPASEQIVERHTNLTRPVDQVNPIPRVTLIRKTVTRMCDGCRDKTRLRQRQRRVVVAGE